MAARLGRLAELRHAQWLRRRVALNSGPELGSLVSIGGQDPAELKKNPAGEIANFHRGCRQVAAEDIAKTGSDCFGEVC